MEGPNAVLSIVTYPPGAQKTDPRIVIDGVRGAIFEYVAGGPLGALTSSWASKAGTDPYGNVYPQGFSAGASSVFQSGSTIVNSAGVFVYAGTPAKNNMIASIAGNTGTDQFGNDYINSTTVYQFIFPSLNRWAAMTMYGSARVVSLTPGSDQTGYVSVQGGETFFNGNWTMEADNSITLLSNNIQASRQISGMTGQIPQVETDVSPHTVGNTTTPTALSKAYTIPASDMNSGGTTYIIEVPLTGTFETQVLHLGILLDSTSIDLCPVGTVIVTAAGHSIVGTARVYLQCTASGSTNNLQAWIDGVIGDATINRGNVPGEGILIGFNGAISLNPAVSHTFAMAGFWAAGVAGQTLTGNGSTFTRKGPLCLSGNEGGFTFTRVSGILVGRCGLTMRLRVSGVPLGERKSESRNSG